LSGIVVGQYTLCDWHKPLCYLPQLEILQPGVKMEMVGTALADDENVLFWNPAGLGVPNEQVGFVFYRHV